MTDTSPFPLHFVVGTGRCGSTLIHEVLCRHPEVRFISNLDDRVRLPASSTRLGSRVHQLLPPSVSRKGRLRFAPSEGYRAMSREVGPVLAEPYRDLVEADATPWLAKRTNLFFRQRAAGGVLVHKWTGWPRARFLHSIFPEARFVHVVRDGRAVANSWLQMAWWRGYQGPERWQWGPLTETEAARWAQSDHAFPVLAAILWNRLIDAAADCRLALPEGAWLDVRYEDMLDDPRATMKSIHRFLDLTERDDGLDRYEYSPSRRDAFFADLGSDVIADMTDVMRDGLAQFNYFTEGPDAR